MNKLSVIITSNKEDRLDDIIDLSYELDIQSVCHEMEIILIVEGETLHHKLKDDCKNLPFFPQSKILQAPTGSGLAGSRNIGIKEATGDIIVFLDDDIELPYQWAENILKAYQNGGYIGITGPAYPSPYIEWFPEELDWLISCTRWTGWMEPRKVASAWGMNMSFRREAFDKCGLFNEDTGYHKGFVAEDVEFSHRVRKMTGKDIWFYPDTWVWHKVYPYRLTPQYIKERSIWIGQTHRMARKLYPEDKLEQNDTDLIKKILRRLPTMTPKQITFTLRALFWVAYGYYVKGLT
jgi:GT2 family glycosyltransferase